MYHNPNVKISLAYFFSTHMDHLQKLIRERTAQTINMSEEVVEDFPRGGAQSLTPLEARKVRDKAEKDVLFGNVEPEKKKRKKSEQIKKHNEFNSTPIKSKGVAIDHFSFKYLLKGLMVLGYVKEINKKDIIVGLPNSLNGCIALSDLHAHLHGQEEDESTDEKEEDNGSTLTASNLFKVGQLIPVVVKELFPSKHGYQKIHLTIFPNDVNSSVTKNCINKNMLLWGAVQSEEDHGYLVSIKKDMSGFLPKAKLKGKLSIGSMMWFNIKQISANKKVVTLSLKNIKDVQVEEKASHFNSILPGQLVKLTVTEVSDEMVSGKIFESFDAVVDLLHLPSEQEPEKLLKKKISGRIIHVNPQTKQIGISCLENIICLPDNIISNKYSIGDIVKGCEIVNADSSSGLVVKMTNGESGIVHISRVSDEHIEKLSKKYKVTTKHKCRVLGYSALDSKYTLTMRNSDLEKEFLRYNDVKPGMLVSGTIITLEEFGCLVKITDHIRGLCPRIHLADITLKHPEKKFTEGKKVKCRVLTVKAETRGLVLTNKKTLVNSELPIITSLEDAKVGDVTHGFVSDIKSFGLFVKFYNGVRALLPKSQINLPKDATLESTYYIGQVLQCTVVSVQLSSNRMTVSLKPPEMLSLKSKTLVNNGEIVSGKFEGFVDAAIEVETTNGEKCLLPLQHLSDFTSINEEYTEVLQHVSRKFTFESLCVIGQDKKAKSTILTQKDLIIKYCDKRVKRFDDVEVGCIYGGVISHIMSYGVFVELNQGVTGLIPNSNLADGFVKDVTTSYQIGQSVVVKVTDADKEKRRFLATMKPSVLLQDGQEVSLNVQYSDLQCLLVYLEQRGRLLNLARSSKSKVIRALPSLLGEVLLVKVESVGRTNITVKYQDNSNSVDVNGIIPQTLRGGADIEIGDECQCYVIYVDLKEKKFIASMNEKMIEEVIKRKTKGSSLKFPSDTKLDSIVTYISCDVVVLILPNQGYTLAYMPARTHLNDISDASKKFVINQKLAVKYERNFNNNVIVENISDEEQNIVVGSIVNAVVKGIKPTQLSVTLLNGKMHGRVHISQVMDSIEEGKSPLQDFKPSQTIQAKILGFRDLKSHKYLPISHTNISKSLVELSVKPSVLAGETTADDPVEKKVKDYTLGESIDCFITSISKSCAWVSVSPSVSGRISFLCLTDDVEEQKKLSSKFKSGFGYSVTVIGHDDEFKHLDLSRIGDPMKLVAKNNQVTGRISKVLAFGLLIQLPNNKCGVAHVTELFDCYGENPLKKFALHQFVRCRVLAVNKDNQVDLSLRESRISGEVPETEFDRVINGYDDIKEGDVLRGYVKSCSKVGVFVSLSHSIVGRVQIKNLSQYFVKDFASLFPVGKLVKAKILSIDPSNNRIDLSLRGKDVGGPDPAPAPKRKSLDENQNGDGDSDGEGNVLKKKKTSDSDEESDDDSDDSVESDDEPTQEDVVMDENTNDAKPKLKLSTAFDWSAKDSDEENDQSEKSDESSDEENNTKALARKTKRQKRAAKKAEEEYLHKAELVLLDTERQMESAEDFDRIILGSPNSSIIWIQYMAFHLHSAEVEKARMVAQRALKTISFREEQEKLNVWVAFLNLESLYGTKETLEKAFQDAVKVNEPKKIYLKMVEIYNKNNKKEEAEMLYQTMLKRFKSSKSVWTGYATFLAKSDQVEEARKLLQRSLKSLPSRKHVETIVKFAILEYKMGEPQRGSTIFESVLKNYPKRTDVWSVYIDMSIKEGDLDQVRNIFERVTTFNMSLKKMKFLFKRYIEFEEQYGSKATVKEVQKKALEYVERTNVDEE
ncbi:protein RRP5 homolog [Hydractinia symbiolongicarpus]|uniref:protein RRP5 homolog n=1 Tax=Hydractinia symbiolongicarpus TaxID=13093 RepID=UPI00254EF4BD|nr:protein RRP5 homolog [Hydractinia symbiolongicarpus]